MSTSVPKSVMVTGANRGIGLGLVHRFLENPKVEHVFATSRSIEKASDLLSIKDPRLHIVKMDVQDDETIFEAEKAVARILGDKGLNLLINNAGLYHHYFLDKYDPENLYKMFDINTAGPLIVCQVFLPLLRKAVDKANGVNVSSACIINITSLAGSHTFNTFGSTFYGENGLIYDGLIPYGMTKSATNMLTRCLAGDLINEGILVCSFCPGLVQTDMGGDKAYLTVEQSTSSLVAVFGRLGAQHSGAYLSHQGVPYGF